MDVQTTILNHWQALARHTPLGILCDLDGTLLPFSPTPAASQMPPVLADRLTALATSPGVRLVIVSGRRRDDLERIVGAIPNIWLMAEHGAWYRRDAAWTSALDPWTADIGPLTDKLRQIADSVPGALVEPKTWSTTFHYRGVSASLREALIVEVTAALEEWLDDNPTFERLDGVDVIEIRPARVRKSLAVSWIREALGADTRLLALGDDVTDEDMFRELGVADESILVGRPRTSRARWRLAGPDPVSAFLDWVVRMRRDSDPTELDRDASDGPLPQPLLPKSSRAGAEGSSLLVISNRLPDINRPEADIDGRRKRNVGGLVSAIEPVLRSRDGVWLGWSGQTIGDETPVGVEIDDSANPTLASLDFSEAWYRRYYGGFCNRTLWPLFHMFPRHVAFLDDEWDCYREVNQVFARAAADLVSPETPIWAHDYHLLMVAGDLRKLGHVGPIGHFLHIPFPAPDFFGLLPWAEQLLDGLLDFDLLGFHTQKDVTNFLQTVAALTPARVLEDSVEHRGRRVRVRAFPIGIIPEAFSEPEAAEEVEALLRAIAPTRLILGVDRLDYTKGIPERLEAFYHLLDHFPQWRGRVSLIQVSVPSREDVPGYREQRQRIENTVGRVNGEFGEAVWVPVRYLYRSYSPAELAALYRAADIGYVTPLRDGMNLVAKEYVAAQDPADPGVLVLSRFAGAAAELKDAVLTNPWHQEGVARDLDRALRMGLEERCARHRRLLAAVSRTTAHTWAEDFLAALTGND